MLELRDLRRYFVVRHNPLARFRHPDHVIRAVDGVSFTVNAGEIFGIIGESGSGKTTLARTVLRLCEPTGGSVLYQGRDVAAMTGAALKQFRREVQPVFQDADSTLDPRQHTGSILEEPLLIHGVSSRDERQHRISAMMEMVNLSPSFTNRHPSELSGGQRQRVAMARALLLDPAVLIADEPTSGLDPLVATQLLALLLRLRTERRLALVLISHDLATVSYASDRIAVMYRGCIVEIADGDAFSSLAAHPYTRFLMGMESTLTETTLIEDLHEHTHEMDRGCAYIHVCPHHMDRCHNMPPVLRQVQPGHLVACHAVR